MYYFLMNSEQVLIETIRWMVPLSVIIYLIFAYKSDNKDP